MAEDADRNGGTEDGSSDVVLIYTTFPDLDTAKRIAGALVERRLVACANLLPEMTAVFRWEGKVEIGSEVAAILKTQSAHVDALRDALASLHPYDEPAFAALPPAQSTAGFGAWVRAETAQLD